MTRKSHQPARLPINDPAKGALRRVDGALLLSDRELPWGEVVARGEVFLRYGITWLGRPHRSIVPELVIADYGALLNGEEAWAFLLDRGHLYPRADVCGLRDDGEEDMVALKQLDFDYPFAVFAYAQAEERRPIGRLSAFIGDAAGCLPARALPHLPRYGSLKAWRDRG